MKFDRYTFQARVLPMYVVILPLGTAFAALYPNVSLPELFGALVVVPGALAMLLSQIGRDAGYRKQHQLWERWGGAPTTQFLRHRNETFNPVLRQRYHERLASLCPNVTIPSPEDEEQDPEAADQVYQACVRHLIAKTRDRERFPLVFKENVNYGFRRNLWGMKPLGIMTSVTSTVAVGSQLWQHRSGLASAPAELVVGAAVTLALLGIWVLWVTPDWVRIPANAYAERLLEASEELQPQQSA